VEGCNLVSQKATKCSDCYSNYTKCRLFLFLPERKT